MLMSKVMEFGKVLFKGNSLVYEAIVLIYNPIMHLFFPFEYLPQRLISTHACSQADTYWLEETQNFKKAKEIIIYDFQIFSLWLIALPKPSFLQVHLIPQWAFFFLVFPLLPNIHFPKLKKQMKLKCCAYCKIMPIVDSSTFEAK